MSRLMFLAVAVAVGLLAGCATTSEPRAARAPAATESADPAVAYMQRVEAVARRRGIGVIWVNPPRKSTMPTTAVQ